MAGRVLLVLAVLLGLSLSACGSQRIARAACPTGERCLEYGNGADPTTLDPQLATATNESAILRELFDGLFTDAADGSPTPGVAESWTTSPDGLVWTFRLKPSVWSDGVPLTAGDFVFAYRRILDPRTASSYAYLAYVLKNGENVNRRGWPPSSVGARALDDHTLQLTLEHPAPFLPQLLKHQALYPVPEHAVRRWGDRWSKPGVMVSNGPYVLKAWRLGDVVRIEKNPRFAGAAGGCFDRVDFYPTNDPISAERRVLRGELDVSNAIQSNRVPRLKRDARSAPFVHAHTALWTSYLIFNTRDVPALRDARARRAISMAIDRRFITDKLLRAGQTPAEGFVPPNIAGYLPRASPHPRPAWFDWTLQRRQAEARRLLAEAGHGPGRPLRLTIKTTNSPGALTYVQSIQADLRAVGVNVDFRQEDGIVIYQSFEARDFQLGTAGWVADYNDPMTFLALMRSSTGLQNYGDYRNPSYDALLAKADFEPDAGPRARDLALAEQLMLDDADVAPLVVNVNLNLVSPTIAGWVDNDADIHPIRDLCRDAAPVGGVTTAANSPRRPF